MKYFLKVKKSYRIKREPREPHLASNRKMKACLPPVHPASKGQWWLEKLSIPLPFLSPGGPAHLFVSYFYNECFGVGQAARPQAQAHAPQGLPAE